MNLWLHRTAFLLHFFLLLPFADESRFFALSLQLVPGGPCDKGAQSLVQPHDRLAFVDGVPVFPVHSQTFTSHGHKLLLLIVLGRFVCPHSLPCIPTILRCRNWLALSCGV